MIYPEAIEVNGVEHAIRTSYLDALACIACINDPDISDTERAFGVIELLYEEPLPEDAAEALRLAVKYLQMGKDPGEISGRASSREPDMDFEEDMHYIRSSFRSDYNIDLVRSPDLHYWEFIELLQGLTDDCILNRIRDLRNYDLSQVKDQKTRSRIIQAQRDVALKAKISKEDQDTIDAFYAQLAIPEGVDYENRNSE